MPTTQSKNPLALGPDPRVQAWLEDVIADAPRHARLLNTFSLMEHIGGRKILLSQGEASDEEVLKHLAEETRHAHFFRRAAESAAGRPLSYVDADLAAASSARMYFGRLDSGISLHTGPGELAYLYVTQAVEVRATWLYHLYEGALRRAGHPLSLRSVIAEEDLHLACMDDKLRRRDPLYAERSARFARLERGHFSRWFEATRRALGQN